MLVTGRRGGSNPTLKPPTPLVSTLAALSTRVRFSDGGLTRPCDNGVALPRVSLAGRGGPWSPSGALCATAGSDVPRAAKSLVGSAASVSCDAAIAMPIKNGDVLPISALSTVDSLLSRVLSCVSVGFMPFVLRGQLLFDFTKT
jgi:hypothetical protein